MKVVVNQKYAHLRHFLEAVPKHSYKVEKECWNRRNVVEIATTPDGEMLVVKRFKPVGLLKGLWYTLFGKSKAQRAYENAEYLLANGFDTACPVGYVEQQRWGVFRSGYFVSEFIPYHTVTHMFMPKPLDDAERGALKRDLVNYITELHGKGIVPLDFNMDNVFYHFDEDAQRYRFSLIDINRMRRGVKTTPADAFKAMAQVGVNVWTIPEFIRAYQEITGFNPDEAAYQVLRKHRKLQHRKWYRNILGR